MNSLPNDAKNSVNSPSVKDPNASGMSLCSIVTKKDANAVME